MLYALVRQNLESFLAYAREHYDGGLPRYVEAELAENTSRPSSGMCVTVPWPG